MWQTRNLDFKSSKHWRSAGSIICNDISASSSSENKIGQLSMITGS